MYLLSTATHQSNFWIVPGLVTIEITPAHIKEATCKIFHITEAALLSKKRSKNLVRARFICMYTMRLKIKITLNEIGKLFNRDHTTVMHAIETIKDELSITAYRHETNELIRSVIELL